MLPNSEHREGLLTGDLGVVVVRALLEQGVGYVVSSWRDRPTPIDAAVDDARERILQPHGVVLRRLRSLAALEPIVTAPQGGITGTPPRGAVVFAGRNGLRPALEQFLSVRCSGSVVGFCFDEDALRIEDAIVVDPEPTANGLFRAIEQALLASRAAQRPALVVMRERALGMRGTIRLAAPLAPTAAADADAAWRAANVKLDVPAAVHTAGLVAGQLGGATHGGQDVLFVHGPLRAAAERALAQVAAALHPAGTAGLADRVAIVDSRALGVLPPPDAPAGGLLERASTSCVIGDRADRMAELLRERLPGSRIHARTVEPGSLRGEDVVRAVASWLEEAHGAVLDEPSCAILAGLAAGGRASNDVAALVSRVPRRNEALHRGVGPAVAAGLALAQGVIGVPARMDEQHPTYRTDSGTFLTVVPGDVYASHGPASAAPAAGPGAFLVTGPASGVVETAAASGATVEYVDGSSPRAIGSAVGRACKQPRVASHVIVVTEVQRVAAPRTSVFGMDPELVGTERLAVSAVPVSATAVVDLQDDLLAGPTLLALDHPDAHAALDPLRELSPATWDLRGSGTGSRMSRLSWNVRRRVMRATLGVDL